MIDVANMLTKPCIFFICARSTGTSGTVNHWGIRLSIVRGLLKLIGSEKAYASKSFLVEAVVLDEILSLAATLQLPGPVLGHPLPTVQIVQADFLGRRRGFSRL